MSTPLDWSEPDLAIEVPRTAIPVLDVPSATGVEILVVQGKDGAGVNLAGAVATYADLPADPGPAGAAYVVQSNGLLYVWSGTEWPAEANGSPFKGDKGDTGRGYTGVTISGDKLAFAASDSTTDQVTVPQIAAASASAQAAAASATAAATSRDAARTSAESAADSEAAAASSRTAAAGSATAAASSAGAAATSRDAAAASATAAAGSAISAGTSKDTAAASAAAASSSATAASSSETNAASSRDSAATSKSASAASASASATSASAASADAQRATEAADRAESAVNTGVADATATTKGGIRLPGGAPGELGGTWDHPTVTGWAAKADLVDGKVPTSQLPSLATSETYVVASTTERLALTTAQVQPGDIAVQTGNPGRGTYILRDADPTQAASWVLMNAPTDAVTSVNGYNGAVVLGKADVNLANVDNTSDAAKPVSTATQTALNGKVPTSRTVTSGTGLTGGGDLTANRTLAVDFGTGAGKVVQGDDARLTDQRVPTDGSVSTAKIADGAVTPAKLGPGRVTGSANGTATSLTLWTGTQAQYDAISSKDGNTVYIVT